MPTKKSRSQQLDREIAAALRRTPQHHATKQAGADDWDVAMDALLEHDPEKAARIVRAIREEHGALVNAPDEFSHAVRDLPQKVRDRFFKLLEQAPAQLVDPLQLRVGQRFDHFGHTYEILKVGRDKNHTVQIARPYTDFFGKVGFIDHRSFPAREFDRQHLRLLTE